MSPFPYGPHEVAPGYQWISLCSIFSNLCSILQIIACLFLLFFWSLYCLSCNLRFLTTPLESSNLSCIYMLSAVSEKYCYIVFLVQSFIKFELWMTNQNLHGKLKGQRVVANKEVTEPKSPSSLQVEASTQKILHSSPCLG